LQPAISHALQRDLLEVVALQDHTTRHLLFAFFEGEKHRSRDDVVVHRRARGGDGDESRPTRWADRVDERRRARREEYGDAFVGRSPWVRRSRRASATLAPGLLASERNGRLDGRALVV